MVRFIDPLPGVVNDFTGPEPAAWITVFPRFAAVELIGVYPGIDARYEVETDGMLKLKFLARPERDPQSVIFEIAEAVSHLAYPRRRATRHSIRPRAGLPVVAVRTPEGFRNRPQILAFRIVPERRVGSAASNTRFGLMVAEYDATSALVTSQRGVRGGRVSSPTETRTARDAGGKRLRRRIPFPT